MSRFIKLFLTGLIICTAFFACEKEYSTENGGILGSGGTGGSSSGTAVYTWTGAPGICATPAISGIFTVGTAMNASNTIVLAVDVTTIGTYIVSTGINNGISFAGSGTFTTTGSQIIILTGTGIPITAGTFSYTPGATGGCSFPITVLPGASVVDCKACAYIPYCNGSSYTYVDSTIGGSSNTSTSGLAFVSDTTIDAKTFSKFSGAGSTPFTYHNCTSGVTTIIAFNGTDRITTTLLKANDAVGSSWTDVFTNAGVQTTYTWSIVAKGFSKTVLSVTYPDVIQVHLVGTANVGGSPVVFALGDYFYARSVGLIDNVTFNTITGLVQVHRVLQNYFIP